MKIKIITNTRKPWAKKLAEEAESFLEKHGHKIVNKNADVTLCIGGDGTLLYAHHQGRIEGTVLGIGSKSSYICQHYRDTWKKEIISSLSSKKIKIMGLKARLGKKKFVALNDFVIHAKSYRVVDITVTYNGKKKSFRGDGIIVSSALGSAAYAYSAGGKKLAPTERKISIVPICPYRRTFSPVIIPPNSKVTIDAGEDCAFILDGIFLYNMKKSLKVNIEKGNDIVFFEGVGKYQ
jgi:NAD+ kinase